MVLNHRLLTYANVLSDFCVIVVDDRSDSQLFVSLSLHPSCQVSDKHTFDAKHMEFIVARHAQRFCPPGQERQQQQAPRTAARRHLLFWLAALLQ